MGRYAVLNSESFKASSGQVRKRVEAVAQDTKPWIEVGSFEHRRYPRFEIHLPIECLQCKSSITHIGNISEGGLLIYLPGEADVGQYLRLKLFFSLGSELHAIRMQAEVVWKDNLLSKEREYYPHGARFVDISSEDGILLRYCLRSLYSPYIK
jgi:hypothetical protein